LSELENGAYAAGVVSALAWGAWSSGWQSQRFLGEYASRIAAAFPPVTVGGRTVQLRPNRRIFAVGRKSAP
jgi:hypothetical protein